ncbi:MAG: hypothetical protein HY270_14205 [Deltaproteobacteria bacterium]|nr:hypothetical protein [Deltaproteobacteria bacterium]
MRLLGSLPTTAMLLLTPMLLPSATVAATYFVDGACPVSGTGANLACGADGPLRTVMEAVQKVAQTVGYDPVTAPVTIDVRGSHDGFDGVYDEYVGLWGIGATAAPGWCSAAGSTTECKQDTDCPSGQTCKHGAYYDLNCTVANPCVIQGCPKSACGQDETPLISALKRRTDWTETGAGSGIWFRTMEARSEFNYDAQFNLSDSYDPGFVVIGDVQDGSRTFVQYSLAGDHDVAPADGRWSYDSTTHRVYLNPAGSANPNSQAAIWIPDRRSIVAHVGSPYSNPDVPAGSGHLNNLTFRRLVLEGARTVIFQSLENIGPEQRSNNLALDEVTLRYAHNMLMDTSGTVNLRLSNVLGEHAGRGTHVDMNAFGFRLFDIQGGTFDNLTVRHIGSAGVSGSCSNANLDRPYIDAPWSSAAGNFKCSNGNGFESKQSANVTVTHYTATDLMFSAFHFDETINGTLNGCNITRTELAIQANEYTPAAIDKLYNIVIAGCTIDDAGWNNVGAIILGTTDDVLPAGAFQYKVCNNFLSHVAHSGVTLDTLNSRGASIDQVKIWNNTIWGDRSALGYPCANGNCPWNTRGGGVVLNASVTGGVSNLEIRNNIFKDVGDSGLSVANVATTAAIIDGNLYHDATGQRQCAVRWKGTCYPTVSTFHSAQPTFEASALSEIDPQLMALSIVPPNLHLAAASGARNSGANLSAQFSSDIDGQPRPASGNWDIGADQYVTTLAAPVLLHAEPMN